MFIKYPKIHRLGKDETDGVLNGRCYVQEKADGSNASIWLGEDGNLCFGSRNNDVTDGSNKSFRNLIAYGREHSGINQFFKDNPNLRLYGEWLVRHSISYSETAYNKFYLFDIMDEDEKFLDIEKVYKYAEQYDILTPQLFGVFDNPTEEQLQEYAGKTNLGVEGEGIVIKNLDFVNRFGNLCYAKIVTQNFKEANAVTFGGNNKHSETYWEMWAVNKFATLARVQKIMHKMESKIGEKLELKHTSMIVGSSYHDMITEEAWEISKKAVSINFRKLKTLAGKKFQQIYKDVLADDISVADID